MKSPESSQAGAARLIKAAKTKSALLSLASALGSDETRDHEKIVSILYVCLTERLHINCISISGIASQKFWGDQTFWLQARKSILFGTRPLEHKTIRYSKNLEGHGPLLPGYSCDSIFIPHLGHVAGRMRCWNTNRMRCVRDDVRCVGSFIWRVFQCAAKYLLFEMPRCWFFPDAFCLQNHAQKNEVDFVYNQSKFPMQEADWCLREGLRFFRGFLYKCASCLNSNVWKRFS